MRQIRRYGLFILLLTLVLSCTFALLACSNDDSSAESSADVLKIRIENLPENDVYSGDMIDLEDASIIATTRGGYTLSVPITQDMLSGFDTNKLGEQTVTISYEGCTVTFTVNVLKAEVQAISIAEKPAVVSVVQGGQLSLSGIKLKVELQSRSIIIDNINSKMLRGYDPSLPVGEHTVYIDYAGFSAPLQIEVLSKSVISLQIVSKPKKLQYFVGDTIMLSGLSILRRYDNGTEDVVTYDDNANLFLPPEYDFSKESSRVIVKITMLDGLFVTFNDCRVVTPRVTKFELSVKPETRPIVLDGRELIGSVSVLEMVEGSKIDWSSGRAIATYDNGATVTIDSLTNTSIDMFYDATNGPSIETNYVFSEVGEHIVYMRYENSEYFTPLYITVRAKRPMELLLGDTRNDGDKIEDREFIDGSRFSTSFLRYNILYDNATYEYEVGDVNAWGSLQESMLSDDSSTFDLSISNLDPVDGKQHVNFTIMGVSNGYKITVVPKTAVSMVIKEPYKNIYATGSVLDFTGSYIYVQYNDKSFERISPIPEECVVLYDGDDNQVTTLSYVGEYKVEVNFGSLKSTFNINAVESSEIVTLITLTERKEVEESGSIVTKVVDMPLDKTYNYSSFEAIPFSDIFMNVATGAGSTMVSLSEAEIIECDRYASGAQTILFRYNGYLFGLNVYFEGRRVSSIEISKAPEKSVYILNADVELDITGLLVTKVFNDGDRGEQNYFDDLWSFSGYDLTTLGIQKVIVTYDLGDRFFTTFFEIEVADLKVSSINFDENQTGVETFEITNESGEVEGFRGIKVTYRDDVNLTYVHTYYDSEGLLVTEIKTLYFDVTYDDGTVVRRELKPSYLSYDKNVNPEISGDFKLTIKINYGGQSTTMNLYVAVRTLEKIEVYNLPDTITYAEGQSLNREGGYIKRTFNDGTTDVLPMTNGLIGIEGYKVNPFENVQGGTYVDQVVTLSYGTKNTTFTVRTYRKLVANPSIGNSIFSYGDESVPVVTIRESISGFDIPQTSLEYLIDGSWVSARPVYPGTYSLRIMVHENEYYEGDIIENDSLYLVIRKKAIIVKIDALSKVYKENDPIFTYVIEDGELVGDDVVEIVLTREAGEDVKYIGSGSSRVIGSYAIIATLTTGGANDNSLYELAYEQVGLTINPKSATTNANGAVINVEFIPPNNANPTTGNIPYTGIEINPFGAKYTDARGFTIMIDAKDILYYDSNGNLLSGLPKERGEYTIKISDNYSFQGNSSMTFKIE